MKAVVYHSYGSADLLTCEEIEKPIPGDSEVLIKVRSASVNPLECGELKGIPLLARALFGLKKVDAGHPGRPGVDVAGIVEQIGQSITRFKPGDEVFGVCVSDAKASGVKVWAHNQGAFAEYVCAPEAALATKPDNVAFEQAAAVPVAGLTALQGLRDKGHIQPHQIVLINGAAGGVGTFAVQIAKAFGAKVTAVCSTRNVEIVRSCGADHVIDYTQQDFTRGAERYDLIFDCVSNHSLSDYARVLNPKGICVIAGDMTGRSLLGILRRFLLALAFSMLRKKRFVTFMAKPSGDDLSLLSGLMQAGKVKPVVERGYCLSDVRQAIRYLETKHARGKVVISLNERPT